MYLAMHQCQAAVFGVAIQVGIDYTRVYASGNKKYSSYTYGRVSANLPIETYDVSIPGACMSNIGFVLHVYVTRTSLESAFCCHSSVSEPLPLSRWEKQHHKILILKPTNESSVWTPAFFSDGLPWSPEDMRRQEFDHVITKEPITDHALFDNSSLPCTMVLLKRFCT